jgi:hypothetical protein
MIQVIVTQYCPDCGSANLVKNGTDYKGAQKFRCHDWLLVEPWTPPAGTRQNARKKFSAHTKSDPREACVASGAPLEWPGRLWHVG